MLKFDLTKTQRTEIINFLTNLNQEIVTIIFMKDKRPNGYATYNIDEIDFEYLIKMHKDYNEVFFMVNEGDGYIYPNKKTPRTKQNVRKVTSLFIDTDSIPLSEVKSYLKEIELKPHYLIESSPKKYHLYFLLTSEFYTRNSQKFQSNLADFQALQLKLAHLGTPTPRTDSAMKDPSRLLRLPNFHHLKNKSKPFLTRIKQEYNHDRYTLDEIKEKVLKNLPLDNQQEQSDSLHSPYSLPSSEVAEGERHHQMTSHLGYLLSLGVSEEIALHSFYSLAKSTFKDYKDFLPLGNRNHEVLSFIKYKKEDLHNEEIKNKNQRRVELLKKYEDKKDIKSRFDLPDDFYYNAPNIVGEITKEISKYAMYPIPSISFAIAVSLLSIIQGKNKRGIDGTPSSSYFLCLAPSGTGKSYPQEVIRHTLNALNKQHLMESKVRSDRGILNWLGRNDGLGLLLSDEAEELLTSLNSDRAGQHIRNFKSILLELYSAYNMKNLSFGEITSRREEPIVLNNPLFNTVLIGTPDIIDNCFSKQAITSGLFQRFNVLYTSSGRVINPNHRASQPLNGHIFSYLRKIASKAILNYEEQLDGKVEKPLTYSKGAEALKDDMISHYDNLYNKELRKGSGLEAIYTRAVEKALRLAVCLSEDVIELSTLEWANTFIEKNTEALYLTASESILTNGVSKEIDDLEKFVANHADEDGVCTYRQILRRFRIRDSRKLKEVLRDAVESGILKKHDNFRRGNRVGRTGIGYSLR